MILAGVLAVVVPILAGSLYWQRQVLLIALWSLPAISVMLLVGFAGELFIGQLAIFSVGAYASAYLTSARGWPFVGALIAGTAIAGIAGIVLALPALRLGAWRLAITSLFMVYVIPDLVNSNPGHLTGGAIGLPGVPPASLFGHQLGTEGLELFCAASVAIVLLLVRNLRASAWGGCLALVRGSHPAAESVGISIFHARFVVYSFSALIAGYAGAIFPHIDGYLGPGSFPLSQAILLLAAPIIGGMATLSGPVVGTALLLLIPLEFVSFVQYSLIIYGGVLIVVTLLLPAGIVPTVRSLILHGMLRSTRRSAETTAGVHRDAGLEAGTEFDLIPANAPIRLEANGVSKSFGGLVALKNVMVEAKPGEITAVIGPNGSGKTTLLNVMTGFYRTDGGSVKLDGVDVISRAPHQVARSGMARTFQVAHLPADQTVLNIIATGSFHREATSITSGLLRFPSARRRERLALEHAYGLLARMGIAECADRYGGELTVGQQRLVEMARALATGNPVILLDEPAAGLVGQEIDHLADLLVQLKQYGYTVLVVDHHMELVMRVADRVVVLNFGEVIASGSPEEVRRDPSVIRAYLGTPGPDREGRPESIPNTPNQRIGAP